MLCCVVLCCVVLCCAVLHCVVLSCLVLSHPSQHTWKAVMFELPRIVSFHAVESHGSTNDGTNDPKPRIDAAEPQQQSHDATHDGAKSADETDV